MRIENKCLIPCRELKDIYERPLSEGEFNAKQTDLGVQIRETKLSPGKDSNTLGNVRNLEEERDCLQKWQLYCVPKLEEEATMIAKQQESFLRTREQIQSERARPSPESRAEAARRMRDMSPERSKIENMYYQYYKKELPKEKEGSGYQP
uniref:Uncharacterized protein n=1 Tax=viral metagenome TaxID=1070528 RepID=A0A6M3J466_9ZZZZ